MNVLQFFARINSPEGQAASSLYSQGVDGMHRLAGWNYDAWDRWREQFQKEFPLHWQRFTEGHAKIMGVSVEDAFVGSVQEPCCWMNEHVRLIEDGWNPANPREFLYEMFVRIYALLEYACDQHNEPYRRLRHGPF